MILLLLLNALAFAALKRNADTLAGCWLGLSVFKFQLILPLVLILLCWKRSRVLQSVVGPLVAVIGGNLGGYYRLGGALLQSPGMSCIVERFMERGRINRGGHAEPARGLLEGWGLASWIP